MRLPTGLLTATLGAASSALAGPTVDVFLLYTPAARAYAGGVAGMNAALQSYVTATNTGYSNSQIDLTLRLVGSSETSYTESSSFNTDLTRLQNASDGFMDEAAGLRDAYGADLVGLIRRDSAAGVAGLAYVGGGDGNASFAPYAFSVTADNWAVGNWAFPHELGHNYGAWHDRQNSSGATHAYAYGWRFYGNNGTQYITVMAYYPGTRILYFSNPSLLYQGQPTGVAAPAANAADVALLHSVSASGTSAYRATKQVVGSGVRADFNGDGVSDLVLYNPSTGARQVWFIQNGARSGSATLNGASTTFQVVALGDFNADNHPDLVYQDLTVGTRSIVLCQATARVGTLALPAGSAVWRIVTSGDFNGDAKPDFFFQNIQTGERVIGLMDGNTRIGTVALPAGSAAWLAVGTGDFNRDGSTDVVYQNTQTGERSIALYQGTTRSGTLAMATGSPLWPIVGAGDFNGDGHADLVYQNTSTGDIVLGFFNGATRTSTANLSGAGVWRVVNH
jgi:hypothetical protein